MHIRVWLARKLHPFRNVFGSAGKITVLSAPMLTTKLLSWVVQVCHFILVFYYAKSQVNRRMRAVSGMSYYERMPQTVIQYVNHFCTSSQLMWCKVWYLRNTVHARYRSQVCFYEYHHGFHLGTCFFQFLTIRHVKDFVEERNAAFTYDSIARELFNQSDCMVRTNCCTTLRRLLEKIHRI